MPKEKIFSYLKERVLNRLSRMGAKKDTVVHEQVSAIGSAPAKHNDAADHQIPSSDEAAFPRFTDLPGELQSIIGAKAVLAGPELLTGVEALLDVSDVSTNHLVTNPILGPILKKITDIRVLADDIHEKIYPKDGLPDFRGTIPYDGPLSAGEHVENSVKRWKYLSHKAKSQVVKDVLGILDFDRRSKCINTLSHLGDALEPVYGRPILREAIGIFSQYSAKSAQERSTTQKLIRRFQSHSTPHNKGDLESSALSIARLKNNIGHEEDLDIYGILSKFNYSKSVLEEANREIKRPSLYRYAGTEDVSMSFEKIDIIPNEMLSKSIYRDLENSSLSARHKSKRVDLIFNRVVEAFERPLRAEAFEASLRAELVENLSYVPGDNRRPLQARADLAGTQRERSDHGR